MRKGLTTGQKRMILLLAGFLIFLGTFLLIYQKNMKRVSSLESDTSDKSSQVEFLSNLQIQVNEMKETTEQKQKEIASYTQEYPSRMTQQKVISNIYQMSVKSGIRLKSISPGTEQIFFKNGEFIEVSEEDTSTSGEAEDTELSEAEKNPEKKFPVNEMVGKVTNYEIELTGTKKQILKAFDWISENPEHMALSAISLSFDSSTGKLSGSIAVNFYCLNGNGKTYEEPDISGIIIGNEDVFGTFKK